MGMKNNNYLSIPTADDEGGPRQTAVATTTRGACDVDGAPVDGFLATYQRRGDGGKEFSRTTVAVLALAVGFGLGGFAGVSYAKLRPSSSLRDATSAANIADGLLRQYYEDLSQQLDPPRPGDNDFRTVLLDRLPQEAASTITVGWSGEGKLESQPLMKEVTTAVVNSKTKQPPLLYLTHDLSYSLLLSTPTCGIGPHGSHYFLYNSGGFDVQINQAYCGAATVATVLNSLRYGHGRSEIGLDLPIDTQYSPYSYATQHDVFGSCAQKMVVRRDDAGGFDGILAPPYGLNLAQVTALLGCHVDTDSGWKVTATPLDKTHVTLGKMRYDIRAALDDLDARVLVNYDRKELGQVGGGHFSPVASYHAGTDAFLILDVAKYKYPPVWVEAQTLYDAMATRDACGSWNFPEGQDDMPDGLSFYPTTGADAPSKEDIEKAMDDVGCAEKLRGYVVVRKG